MCQRFDRMFLERKFWELIKQHLCLSRSRYPSLPESQICLIIFLGGRIPTIKITRVLRLISYQRNDFSAAKMDFHRWTTGPPVCKMVRENRSFLQWLADLLRKMYLRRQVDILVRSPTEIYLLRRTKPQHAPAKLDYTVCKNTQLSFHSSRMAAWENVHAKI